MSAHRATHVQAPNFAFKLAARKWRARRPRAGDDAVDLSSLRHLFNAVRGGVCCCRAPPLYASVTPPIPPWPGRAH